jgi:beta-lactamase class C
LRWLISVVTLLFAVMSAGVVHANGDLVAAPVDEPVYQPVFNYDFAEFIHWLNDARKERNIPGAALAIVSSDGIMQLHTWGDKEVGSNDPVDPTAIFRIASMSKTFAGAATAMLVEEEQESWDTLLTDLFPGMQLGNSSRSRTITLKHVISHSTGLMPHSYSNMLDHGVDYGSIKRKFKEIPTVCSPGECYGYQNVVFSLVGDVIEQHSGDSYAHYIEEKLFKPLGMVHASVGLDAYNAATNATSPHRKVRGGRWRPTSTNAAYYTVAPASGINASVYDMTLWLRANLGAFPEVLPPELLTEMHSPVIDTPYGNYFNRWSGLEKAYYGIGWRVMDFRGVRAVHHGGGVRGYRSEMVFVPSADIGMVLMFNAESNLANDVVPTFLDNLLIRGAGSAE